MTQLFNPQPGVTYSMRDLASQLQPGQSVNMRTGEIGGTNPANNNPYTGLTQQQQQRASDAANAGYGTIGTGYLYGVGGQTLADQSHTYNGGGYPGGGNIAPGSTPNPGQMTWDQWAQNMQSNYGVPNPGTLGGTSGGNVPGQPNNKVAQASPYGSSYTGFGNSNVGVNNGQTPTTTTPTAPPGTAGNPTTPTPNGGGDQSSGGMNAVQQLINGGKPQVGVPPAPNASTTYSSANNPNPFSNVSSNPYPNITTQPIPKGPVAPPLGGFKPSNSLYNNLK